MSEQNLETGRGRQAAHERLATGGLARWARMCATHPWRVVFSWIGIVAFWSCSSRRSAGA